MANKPTFITRVVIENYKSIAYCDVRLGPLTFLVGRNGSGKSNFLDALNFMADALRLTLDGAIRARSNIATISRLTGEVYSALGVHVEFELPDGRVGGYGFEIGERLIGIPYALHREECSIWEPGKKKDAAYFRVRDGQVETNIASMPATLPDHLYLVNASGFAPFQDAYKALAAMHFYHIDPDRVQHSASAGEDRMLAEDGSNSAGVLLSLINRHPETTARIREYMRAIVPDMVDVFPVGFGGRYSLAFKQGDEADQPLFRPEQMSDGTLRALGILLALFQVVPDADRLVSLIAMEEPETGLHRAALAALRDAFLEASETVQLLATTHSTDLLDAKDFKAEWLRVVTAERGATHIGPLSEATVSIVRDHLSTAGELLRSSPLRPVVRAGTQSGATLFND